VNDARGKVMHPAPPSNLSAGDNDTEGTVCMVSRYASVQSAVRPGCWPPGQHIVPLGRPLVLLSPDVLAPLEHPAASRWPLPLSSTGCSPVTPGCTSPVVL